MTQPLTRKQLAERFGVSLHTVDRWIASARISYLKIGSLVKFTEQQIAQFEKAHTVKAPLLTREPSGNGGGKGR